MGEVLKNNTELPTLSSFTVSEGDGILQVGERLWIRSSYLSGVSNSWDIRAGDSFVLTMKPEGGWWVLTRIRNNKTLRIDIPAEGIYQDSYRDENFAGLVYKKLPNTNKYIFLWPDRTPILVGKQQIKVDTANLDTLRRAMEEISWPFITECSSDSAQKALACEVEQNPDFSKSVTINSTSILDWYPRNVSLEKVLRLTNLPESALMELSMSLAHLVAIR